MNITLDKIASVTYNLKLPTEVEISDNIISEEGAVLAVEVLEDKKKYNKLELPSGRLSTLKKGDVIAVSLGNRKALKGFVGNTPESLEVGNVISVLNLGGVAGECISENIKEVGHVLKIKVLGAIVNSGKNLNIKQAKLFSEKDNLKSNTPLIVVSGTCMHVGKTSAACEIIKHALHNKMTIFGAKLAGVAALKDTENMKDYGAKKVTSFVDAGYPSTVNGCKLPVTVTKGSIDYLSEDNPDAIVIEFGDGVYGEYGVLNILKDPEIQKNIVSHIGCAHDPAGALQLAEICKEIGAPLDVISGPVSDNSVGVNFIKKKLNIPAINALNSGDELFNYILIKSQVHVSSLKVY